VTKPKDGQKIVTPNISIHIFPFVQRSRNDNSKQHLTIPLTDGIFFYAAISAGIALLAVGFMFDP
jgi:hypothetical protein